MYEYNSNEINVIKKIYRIYLTVPRVVDEDKGFTILVPNKDDYKALDMLIKKGLVEHKIDDFFHAEINRNFYRFTEKMLPELTMLERKGHIR